MMKKELVLILSVLSVFIPSMGFSQSQIDLNACDNGNDSQSFFGLQVTVVGKASHTSQGLNFLACQVSNDRPKISQFLDSNKCVDSAVSRVQVELENLKAQPDFKQALSKMVSSCREISGIDTANRYVLNAEIALNGVLSTQSQAASVTFSLNMDEESLSQIASTSLGSGQDLYKIAYQLPRRDSGDCRLSGIDDKLDLSEVKAVAIHKLNERADRCNQFKTAKN